MNKVSNKCGFGSCGFYRASEKSNCRIYDDRRNCQKSMRKKSKISNHSKRRSKKEINQ